MLVSFNFKKYVYTNVTVLATNSTNGGDLPKCKKASNTVQLIVTFIVFIFHIYREKNANTTCKTNPAQCLQRCLLITNDCRIRAQ